MNVPYEKVLQKMEQEIAAARTASGADRERHMYAIKSMCELMIGASSEPVQPVPVQPVSALQPMQPPVQNAKRLPADGGANGESIFDF